MLYLECHVFEKVSGAIVLLILESTAGIDPNANSCRFRVSMFGGNS